MPNWVKQNVVVEGSVKNINKFIKANFTKDSHTGEYEFNFQKIIPMPKNIFTGDLGREEREKYGQNNWYDWSLKNWGTKWPACETVMDDFSKKEGDSFGFSFNTAWAVPLPIYNKLTKKYPDLVFRCEFADEDFGTNCGTINIEDGSYNIEFIEDESFAKDVWSYK